MYLSVCSGIEAATVAWHRLGWTPVAFSEIEPFPCAVLAHHYPDTPNLGDMTTFKEWDIGAIDVLVGGTPCQSFSVAGLRKGLDDPRGNLMLVYLAIARRFAPRWVVWENVPGVLSSSGGGDFGTFLGGLAECGYGFAYRILDAQWFGVPQRRRRVFVVGYLRDFGDWRAAAAVLFERESLRGYPPPSREAGERVALSVTSRVDRGGEHREAHGNNLVAGTLGANHGNIKADHAWTGQLISNAVNAHGGSGRMDGESETFITGTLNASGKAAGSATQQDAEAGMLIAHALRADGFDASEDGTGRGTPLIAAAINPDHEGKHSYAGDGGTLNLISGTLRGHTRPGSNSLSGMTGVRRLTPRECERLQGFPDDYTAIPYRGKPAADGPRYKALGNTMAIPCMAWIGERIDAVEAVR
jgi:DNA (cytosine-5)-methyltransferase 1